MRCGAHLSPPDRPCEDDMTADGLASSLGRVNTQVMLTKRRAVDLCRVATCLCLMP
jgi:hypothetical protein